MLSLFFFFSNVRWDSDKLEMKRISIDCDWSKWKYYFFLLLNIVLRSLMLISTFDSVQSFTVVLLWCSMLETCESCDLLGKRTSIAFRDNHFMIRSDPWYDKPNFLSEMNNFNKHYNMRSFNKFYIPITSCNANECIAYTVMTHTPMSDIQFFFFIMAINNRNNCCYCHWW